jgi:hypothetical protein
MFKLRRRNRAGVRSPGTSTRAPNTTHGLPEIPSLEGYTIQELQIEQLARLITFDELKPDQLSKLISALARAGRSE